MRGSTRGQLNGINAFAISQMEETSKKRKRDEGSSEHDNAKSFDSSPEHLSLQTSSGIAAEQSNELTEAEGDYNSRIDEQRFPALYTNVGDAVQSMGGYPRRSDTLYLTANFHPAPYHYQG